MFARRCTRRHRHSCAMCWYVLLSLCLFYQTAKPEQARWTAERSIYGPVIGISVPSWSILIADASFRGCVRKSSKWQDYYVSVRCKIKINLKKNKPSQGFLCGWRRHQTTQWSDGQTEREERADWLVKSLEWIQKQIWYFLSVLESGCTLCLS